jgi:hypothetical protein
MFVSLHPDINYGVFSRIKQGIWSKALFGLSDGARRLKGRL